MPNLPSPNVLLKMPETSGVNDEPCSESGRLLFESSYTPLTPTLACRPGLSSGRAVLGLVVAPMPPVGIGAWLVLYTWISAIASDARLAKSNAREFDADVSLMLAPGIWRPLSST